MDWENISLILKLENTEDRSIFMDGYKRKVSDDGVIINEFWNREENTFKFGDTVEKCIGILEELNIQHRVIEDYRVQGETGIDTVNFVLLFDKQWKLKGIDNIVNMESNLGVGKDFGPIYMLSYLYGIGWHQVNNENEIIMEKNIDGIFFRVYIKGALVARWGMFKEYIKESDSYEKNKITLKKSEIELVEEGIISLGMIRSELEELLLKNDIPIKHELENLYNFRQWNNGNMNIDTENLKIITQSDSSEIISIEHRVDEEQAEKEIERLSKRYQYNGEFLLKSGDRVTEFDVGGKSIGFRRNNYNVVFKYIRKYGYRDLLYLNGEHFNLKLPLDIMNIIYLDNNDLEILRNAYYARQGYIFKTERINNFFKEVYWYRGTNQDVEDELTELDRENIKKITKLENTEDRSIYLPDSKWVKDKNDVVINDFWEIEKNTFKFGDSFQEGLEILVENKIDMKIVDNYNGSLDKAIETENFTLIYNDNEGLIGIDKIKNIQSNLGILSEEGDAYTLYYLYGVQWKNESLGWNMGSISERKINNNYFRVMIGNNRVKYWGIFKHSINNQL